MFIILSQTPDGSIISHIAGNVMQNAATLIIEDLGQDSKNFAVSLQNLRIIGYYTGFLHALSYFLKTTTNKTPIHFNVDIIYSSTSLF